MNDRSEGSSGLSWTWEGGAGNSVSNAGGANVFGGWPGAVIIGVVVGFVTAVAEALGEFRIYSLSYSREADGIHTDLGSVDDNLSLPVITGGCIWGLFKVLGWLGSVFS